MKTILFVFMLCTLSGCSPQQRTADYVDEHHCLLYARRLPHVEWDYVAGRLRSYVGYNDYHCSNPDLIIIDDDEVQPRSAPVYPPLP
jgi:hypothetical protein